MRILFDTAPVWGLCNKLDQHHRASADFYLYLRKHGAEFVVPRIFYLELMGHRTSAIKKNLPKHTAPQLALLFHKQLVAYRFKWIEHEKDDFVLADGLWAKYADWPVDYPDVLIAVTANRLKADRPWTFDTEFERFLIKAFPMIESIRNRVPESP